mgnify:CR=1 FL=1
MFGIIYIVLSLLAGKELAEILLFTGKNAQEAGSRTDSTKLLQSDMGSGGEPSFGNGNTGIWMDNIHDLLGGQRSRC